MVRFSLSASASSVCSCNWRLPAWQVSICCIVWCCILLCTSNWKFWHNLPRYIINSFLYLHSFSVFYEDMQTCQHPCFLRNFPDFLPFLARGARSSDFFGWWPLLLLFFAFALYKPLRQERKLYRFHEYVVSMAESHYSIGFPLNFSRDLAVAFCKPGNSANVFWMACSVACDVTLIIRPYAWFHYINFCQWHFQVSRHSFSTGILLVETLNCPNPLYGLIQISECNWCDDVEYRLTIPLLELACLIFANIFRGVLQFIIALHGGDRSSLNRCNVMW